MWWMRAQHKMERKNVGAQDESHIDKYVKNDCWGTSLLKRTEGPWWRANSEPKCFLADTRLEALWFVWAVTLDHIYILYPVLILPAEDRLGKTGVASMEDMLGTAALVPWGDGLRYLLIPLATSAYRGPSRRWDWIVHSDRWGEDKRS